MPVVIAYTVCIYWIFRGKVKLDRMSDLKIYDFRSANVDDLVHPSVVMPVA